MKIPFKCGNRNVANGVVYDDAKDDSGFTLLELLVVLGIIALLATVAAPQVLGYLGKARTGTSKAQISAISTALELYALDMGTYPSQQAGLNALVQAPPRAGAWKGPYLKKAEGLVDPWGHPYQYKFPGPGGGPQVYTLGRDNNPGGTGEDQDVSN
ncbi:type II secretion system major pseudopilin GspG [Hyphomicrobium facile]|uniref:Type II secretion system core protein G n=1 Tax=Hyphomicrobium facile TaxID=51670 RepID=A0A1I7NQN2_9HYPH|nr:type II secretion system major pseudopilin GspG [Hyphomicrobium facile]SFV36986.1 general secretion pathway protein G [Hyphomicrobium facile]